MKATGMNCIRSNHDIVKPFIYIFIKGGRKRAQINKEKFSKLKRKRKNLLGHKLINVDELYHL